MDKIEKIRNPYLTEDEKMDIIADVIEEGGGGGGASGFETLELVINPDNNTIETTKTVREIIALYTSGKCFASSLALDPDPDSLTCVQVYYGTLIYMGEDGYLLSGFTHSPESITRLESTAPEDLDAVFTAPLPH